MFKNDKNNNLIKIKKRWKNKKTRIHNKDEEEEDENENYNVTYIQELSKNYPQKNIDFNKLLENKIDYISEKYKILFLFFLMK